MGSVATRNGKVFVFIIEQFGREFVCVSVIGEKEKKFIFIENSDWLKVADVIEDRHEFIQVENHKFNKVLKVTHMNNEILININECYAIFNHERITELKNIEKRTNKYLNKHAFQT